MAECNVQPGEVCVEIDKLENGINLMLKSVMDAMQGFQSETRALAAQLTAQAEQMKAQTDLLQEMTNRLTKVETTVEYLKQRQDRQDGVGKQVSGLAGKVNGIMWAFAGSLLINVALISALMAHLLAAK